MPRYYEGGEGTLCGDLPQILVATRARLVRVNDASSLTVELLEPAGAYAAGEHLDIHTYQFDPQPRRKRDNEEYRNEA